MKEATAASAMNTFQGHVMRQEINEFSRQEAA